MTKRFAAVALTISCSMCSIAAEARADGERDTRWYGWQVLVSDAVSTGVIVAGGKVGTSGNFVLVLTGAAGYVVVPPIIHGGHAQGTSAVASLALRIALPLGGAFAFQSVTGLGVGAAVATLIDSAVLAHEPVPSRWADTAIAPLVIPRRDGVTLGLTTHF